jgi:hypothetical protein
MTNCLQSFQLLDKRITDGLKEDAKVECKTRIEGTFELEKVMQMMTISDVPNK